MNRERERIKNRLDEELGGLQFGGQEETLRRTHPRSWRDRLRAFWNKEIEVSLLPLGASLAVILAVAAIYQLSDAKNDSGDTDWRDGRQLVEAGGNTYWKDDYERAVASIEGND
ncbi:hypothetical protein [Cohnella terricola]|uniref:Uncharacterized protein n=1 Tax=Cohnella terricola TaxID=1289167 RepID=A0A559JMT1_9BACL|nr:hypothetical protein [Cohnella terricola]TVY01194.1 hypothetical protein FPZ45_08575 [Cohnella terricola]